jgi:hypothetical protein
MEITGDFTVVTEYLGTFAEPTVEERELADRKRQLVEQLREETGRVRESFGPVMRMHGDETVGFVSHDEWDTVERAAREFSESKKKAEEALAESEKHHGLIGTALFVATLASVGVGYYLDWMVGVLNFVVAAACIMPFALLKSWPDSARAKLEEIDLARSVAAARPRFKNYGYVLGDRPREIEWLAVGREGVALLDDENRPSYVPYSRFSSVYADTQARHLGFKIAAKTEGKLLIVTLSHPQTADIPTTRAYVEDSVADYIATAIAAFKSRAD